MIKNASGSAVPGAFFSRFKYFFKMVYIVYNTIIS